MLKSGNGAQPYTPNPAELEAIGGALQALRALRSGVGDVFRRQPDGLPPEEVSEPQTKIDLIQCLTNISKELRKLEANVQRMSKSDKTALQPCVTWQLCLDPAVEETSLYRDIVNTHRWFDKLHDYSGLMATTFYEEQTKRSEKSVLGQRRRKPVSWSSRVMRVLPEHVDGFIATIRPLLRGMFIDVLRPYGRNTILKITLARTMKAIVVLHGLSIDSVLVKGYQEELFTDEDADEVNLFSRSRYRVFRRVTDNATAASIEFDSPSPRLLGLKLFLYWLHSYMALFSSVCETCNKLLKDSYPPTWRDFKTGKPYHDGCKPA